MSASLVGSEMCIRDRSLAPSLLASWRVPAIGETKRAPASSSTTHWLYTVSYTHLTLPTICSV
eukprot:2652268-Alexandrium_andersonii.AAC.1